MCLKILVISLFGYIAQSFIASYPDLVIGFIAIGSTPLGGDYYSMTDRFFIKHFDTIAKCYPYSYYCKVSSKGVAVTEEAKENMYRTLLSLGKPAMLKASRFMYSEFLEVKEEVEMKCPVWLTYGEKDGVGFVKKYNKSWSENKGYDLIVIDEASHNANFDNHTQFNQLVETFVKTII